MKELGDFIEFDKQAQRIDQMRMPKCLREQPEKVLLSNKPVKITARGYRGMMQSLEVPPCKTKQVSTRILDHIWAIASGSNLKMTKYQCRVCKFICTITEARIFPNEPGKCRCHWLRSCELTQKGRKDFNLKNSFVQAVEERWRR